MVRKAGTAAKAGTDNPVLVALRGSRGIFWSVAAFSALMNLLALAPAIYMLQIYDRVITSGGLTTLIVLTGVLVWALLCLSLLDAVRSRLLIRAGVRMDAALAGLLQHRLLSRSASRLPPGVAGQTMRDIDSLRSALSGATALAIMDLPWAPIFLIAAFLLHPLLGMLGVAGAALLIFLAWLNRKATSGKAEAAIEATNATYATVDAVMSNAEAVRALGMRRALIARQTAERQGGAQLLVTAQIATAGFSSATRFTRLLLQSLALGCGALLVIDNLLSAGAVFAVSLIIARGLQPIEQIIGSWSTLQTARTAYENVQRVLRVTAVEDGPVPMALPAPKGLVRLENVSVRSPAGVVVLKNVSFTIEPGEILGIIGTSGAGKTTLTRILSGAIAPDAGVIRMDGADYASWDAERLGGYIGYLPQHSGLLAGTIRDNVSRFTGWTDSDTAAIDGRVIEAARAADLHDFILSLPDGYDTVLGPRGEGLSAGQGQRVALARALFGEPSLLVLDEPNSHLDGAGEESLMKSLSLARERGTAVVIVAHRSNVLNIADRLLLLQEGQVASFGTRSQVINQISEQRKLQASAQQAEAV